MQAWAWESISSSLSFNRSVSRSRSSTILAGVSGEWDRASRSQPQAIVAFCAWAQQAR